MVDEACKPLADGERSPVPFRGDRHDDDRMATSGGRWPRRRSPGNETRWRIPTETKGCSTCPSSLTHAPYGYRTNANGRFDPVVGVKWTTTSIAPPGLGRAQGPGTPHGHKKTPPFGKGRRQVSP